MKFVFERIVRGEPMSDADFKKYEWRSDLVDKIAATVIARRSKGENSAMQNIPAGSA